MRGALLWWWQAPPPQGVRAAAAMPMAAAVIGAVWESRRVVAPGSAVSRVTLPATAERFVRPIGGKAFAASHGEAAGISSVTAAVLVPAAEDSAAPASAGWVDHHTPDRWTLAAWSAVRPGQGMGGVSPQLGGTQSGLRGAWRIDRAERSELFVRLVADGLPPHRVELAGGVALRPFRALPMQIAIERRVPLAGAGGRSAFAVYAVGGVADMPVAGAWRLDGYGAGGIVGLRRRDAFVEGWATLRHPVTAGRAISLSVGAGLWGAAQPGATRLDAGPSVAATWRRDGVSPRLSLDWRQRLAGEATPGSGLAVTLGVDF
jgi:hypothetical protein